MGRMPDIHSCLPMRCIEALRRTLIAASIMVPSCAWSQGGIQPEWRSIQPELKSAPQIDIASIVPHESGWAAWTRSPVFAVDIPKGIDVPKGSMKWVRMHVNCRESSANVAFLEARLVAPSGAILQTVKREEAGAQDYPSAGGIPYGISPPAMICAAAAARCQGKPLAWPLVRDDRESFLPSCGKFDKSVAMNDELLSISAACRNNPRCVFSGQDMPIDVRILNRTNADITLPLEYLRKRGPIIRLADRRSGSESFTRPNLVDPALREQRVFLRPSESVTLEWVLAASELRQFGGPRVDVSTEISIRTQAWSEGREIEAGGRAMLRIVDAADS
ncbi:MAG: hypothetical protein LBE61_19125 [Burkholderiaceae bacterium]|nr:hypothetical protein [Burkholderiaceae bacterium]